MFDSLGERFSDSDWLLLRVVVLDKVTDLLLFFGKLLVVAGVGKDETLTQENTRKCFKGVF